MTLATKIDRLKDEHADEELTKLQDFHESRAKDEAIFVLGRIKQNDHIGTAIGENLAAQTTLALQRFQQEKKHEVLGFDTFDRFLNESPYSPMRKTQYYERLAIINTHGSDVADLLTAVGISMRSQKLLESGDLEIRDDRIYVAGREIDAASTGVLKDVLSELFDERRQLKSELSKSKDKLDKQEDVIKTGREENEELRRNLDSLNENSPFERALMGAVKSMLTLVGEVKELSDEERAERGDADLKTFAEQWFQLRDAYGVKQQLAERAAGSATMENIMDRAIAEGDDGDLD
jgi:hypothetical protein